VNAKLHRGKRKAVETSGAAKVPVGKAVGNPSGTADPKLEGGHESSKEVSGDTQTMGERIYAICYRKVNVIFK
jgi:hypothetical protein